MYKVKVWKNFFSKGKGKGTETKKKLKVCKGCKGYLYIPLPFFGKNF